jgi:hypothetical protein
MFGEMERYRAAGATKKHIWSNFQKNVTFEERG